MSDKYLKGKTPWLIGRRSFLCLLGINAISCSSGPRHRNIQEVSNRRTEFDFKASATAGNNKFDGKSVRIEKSTIRTYNETYKDQYGVDPNKIISKVQRNGIFDIPGIILRAILIPVFKQEPDGVVVSKTGEKRLRKELVQTRSKLVSLSERDRTINIVIESDADDSYFVGAKTNSSGEFVFDFRRFVRENKLPARSYVVSFFHPNVTTPKTFRVSSSQVAAMMPKQPRMGMHSYAGGAAVDARAFFNIIDIASAIKTTYDLARMVYRIYKRYRVFSLAFAKAVACALFPQAIVRFIVGEAVLYFAKFMFRRYAFPV